MKRDHGGAFSREDRLGSRACGEVVGSRDRDSGPAGDGWERATTVRHGESATGHGPRSAPPFRPSSAPRSNLRYRRQVIICHS